MDNKVKDISSKSLSQIAWHRLKKNKLSLFGLSIIFLAILVAFLGPIVRPDGTPQSNDQILEITTKKPGFSVDILKVKKNQKQKEIGVFEYISVGVDNDFTTVPIYDYSFEGYNLIVEKYTGANINNGQILKYNLADIVYALDHNEVTESDGYLDFYTIDGGKQHNAITDLVATIKEDYIVSRKLDKDFFKIV